mmetsp:Transcript_18985/g.39294  ORF Transcript_18985/g.39294 Transcript_18985/m.39294 type:complete len:214 (-) Transcript_18985:635-1276(-)
MKNAISMVLCQIAVPFPIINGTCRCTEVEVEMGVILDSRLNRLMNRLGPKWKSFGSTRVFTCRKLFESALAKDKVYQVSCRRIFCEKIIATVEKKVLHHVMFFFFSFLFCSLIMISILDCQFDPTLFRFLILSPTFSVSFGSRSSAITNVCTILLFPNGVITKHVTIINKLSLVPICLSSVGWKVIQEITSIHTTIIRQEISIQLREVSCHPS